MLVNVGEKQSKIFCVIELKLIFSPAGFDFTWRWIIVAAACHEFGLDSFRLHPPSLTQLPNGKCRRVGRRVSTILGRGYRTGTAERRRKQLQDCRALGAGCRRRGCCRQCGWRWSNKGRLSMKCLWFIRRIVGLERTGHGRERILHSETSPQRWRPVVVEGRQSDCHRRFGDTPDGWRRFDDASNGRRRRRSHSKWATVVGLTQKGASAGPTQRAAIVQVFLLTVVVIVVVVVIAVVAATERAGWLVWISRWSSRVQRRPTAAQTLGAVGHRESAIDRRSRAARRAKQTPGRWVLGTNWTTQ